MVHFKFPTDIKSLKSNWVRELLEYGAYESYVQSFVVQAEYWHVSRFFIIKVITTRILSTSKSTWISASFYLTSTTKMHRKMQLISKI
jgi:hypothetical protein